MSFPVPDTLISPQENERADQAVSRAQLLTRPDEWRELAERLPGTPALGLDTEFVRERTFFPRPGLVQLSDGERIWLLDPVAQSDFSGLESALRDSETIKVLHSVGEDLEIFQLLTQTVPRPLFDTQIAAAMLGQPLQTRYETLCETVFGVQLAGGQARSNWCKRPLAPELLTYAAQDVIWLPRLQQVLSESLEDRGRLEWLQEDCKRLVDRAEADEAGDPLVRVKGAGRLDDEALACLRALAQWRDRQARQRDLPRSFVMRDEPLLELAAAGRDPQRRAEAFGKLPERARARHRAALEALLDEVDPSGFERPAELHQLTPDQRQAIKLAQNAVRTLAERLGVDPALIASKRELTKVVRGERPDWLDGWRGPLLAEALAGIAPGF